MKRSATLTWMANAPVTVRSLGNLLITTGAKLQPVMLSWPVVVSWVKVGSTPRTGLPYATRAETQERGQRRVGEQEHGEPDAHSVSRRHRKAAINRQHQGAESAPALERTHNDLDLGCRGDLLEADRRRQTRVAL